MPLTTNCFLKLPITKFQAHTYIPTHSCVQYKSTPIHSSTNNAYTGVHIY